MPAGVPEIERTFVEETNRLTAERLPIAAAAFAVVFGAAWLFEHQANPNRDAYYAVLYVLEVLSISSAAWLSRLPQWGLYARPLAVAGMLALIFLIGVYHVIVQGEGEVLALALLYLLTGAMVLLPWGWQGQLPVAVGALLTFAIAVFMGERLATPLAINFIGLSTISALSVSGAAFMAGYRLRFLRQAAELRAANVALAEANQAKNQFLAGVSHELRTPLNIIVGYTDLLLEGSFGALPGEATDALDRVARNSRMLVYLISDLLDLARIEAGRLAVQLGPVELTAVFAQMTQFVEAKLDSEAVQFHVHPPGHLRVFADGDRLEQILVNLLSNATKFTARGEIHLEAQATGDGMVAIEVRDTGIGIDERELPSIFQPFSQGAVGRKLGGVGIGLSLSSRLAQAMGGNLTVRSAVGQGSTFTLRLPAGR